jgi:hypothetical protein
MTLLIFFFFQHWFLFVEDFQPGNQFFQIWLFNLRLSSKHQKWLLDHSWKKLETSPPKMREQRRTFNLWYRVTFYIFLQSIRFLPSIFLFFSCYLNCILSLEQLFEVPVNVKISDNFIKSLILWLFFKSLCTFIRIEQLLKVWQLWQPYWVQWQ